MPEKIGRITEKTPAINARLSGCSVRQCWRQVEKRLKHIIKS